MSVHLVCNLFFEWAGAQEGGVDTYDAFYDPLKEDRLSFVVRVFHPGNRWRKRTLLRGLCTGQVGPKGGDNWAETGDNLVASI